MAQRLGCACQVSSSCKQPDLRSQHLRPKLTESCPGRRRGRARVSPVTVIWTAGKLRLGIRHVKQISQITSQGRTHQPSLGLPGCAHGLGKQDILRWQIARKPLAKYRSALLFFFFFFGWVRRLWWSSSSFSRLFLPPPTPVRNGERKRRVQRWILEKARRWYQEDIWLQGSPWDVSNETTRPQGRRETLYLVVQISLRQQWHIVPNNGNEGQTDSCWISVEVSEKVFGGDGQRQGLLNLLKTSVTIIRCTLQRGNKQRFTREVRLQRCASLHRASFRNCLSSAHRRARAQSSHLFGSRFVVHNRDKASRAPFTYTNDEISSQLLRERLWCLHVFLCSALGTSLLGLCRGHFRQFIPAS